MRTAAATTRAEQSSDLQQNIDAFERQLANVVRVIEEHRTWARSIAAGLEPDDPNLAADLLKAKVRLELLERALVRAIPRIRTAQADIGWAFRTSNSVPPRRPNRPRGNRTSGVHRIGSSGLELDFSDLEER